MKNYSQKSLLNNQPSETGQMKRQPDTDFQVSEYGAELRGKTAIISGGDSGIGQAVAILYASFGINVLIGYYDEKEDAQATVDAVEANGAKCIAVSGDVRDRTYCDKLTKTAFKEFGRIDIVINNASVQYPQEDFLDITPQQLEQTFAVNVFGMFYLTQSALKYLKKGGVIINTTSVTAFRGSDHLVDYAATKAAIVGFTRSLASQLASKDIRVNAVAPGPVLTPLIPASFDAKYVKQFGKDTPMGRPGQPYEIAPSFVFLALEQNSYMTGQVLHPNGGDIVN